MFLISLYQTQRSVALFPSQNIVFFTPGVDPTANQDDEVTDRETFQVEFDKKAEQWRILTADNKYWSLEAASGIQAIGNAQLVRGLCFSV